MSEGGERPRARVESDRSHESTEKNVREHLELRLLYAEAMSETSGKPISGILLRGSDLHARIFGYIPGRDPQNVAGAWWGMRDELDKAATHEERLDVINRYYRVFSGEQKDHTEDPFWPFRYDPPQDGVISLHFGSMSLLDSSEPGEPALLSRERFEEQREKLKAMFKEIKERYPEAREVRGGSWLYNREAYRRLYPPSYTENPVARKAGEFVGGGTWGQFRTGDGKVNQAVKAEFIKRLKDLDVEDPHKVFPMETLTVKGPIEDFYAFYGV